MPLNVIVIDDSPIQLLMATKLIERNPDLTLLGAYANPLLGLMAVNTMQVDLVLLDVEMPGMNGFEFKAQMTKEVSVVMNSTRTSFQEQAKQVGAVDFLCKPIGVSKLEATVARIQDTKNPHITKRLTAIAS